MKNNKNTDQDHLCQTPKFESKDTIAIIIAIFQFLAPIFAIAFAILAVVLLFITKVWLK